MSIEKPLYEVPQGLEAVAGPEIEVEVLAEEGDEAPVVETTEIDLLISEEPPFETNLATLLDDSQLAEVATDLIELVEREIQGRSDWEETYKKGMDLLGLKIEEKSEPWEGACGVFHPLLSEAIVRFQAEMITETFPASGPVRTEVIGKETQETMDAARRVREDMNYQLTERMTDYRSEHEKMLWSLPAVGSAFKKVYYDPSLGRVVSMFVPAEDLILPYGFSDLDAAPRYTHVLKKTKNQFAKDQLCGFYREVDLGDPVPEITDIAKRKDRETGLTAIRDDRYTFWEIHTEYDLPGFEDEDGIALPYVITLDKATRTVLSIRRNWNPDDPKKLKRQHFVHYQYIPGDGAYGYGLIHLVGGMAKGATSLLRQLVDAGTLANLPGGLKTRGLRIKGDDTPIAPGEFRDVDVPGQSIKDNIMTLPYKEPSQTLAALLAKIVEEGRRFAAISDVNVSDMSAQAPVGTTLALLERQLKTMSAVQARTHFSMRREFGLIKALVADALPDEPYAYEPVTATPEVRRADYALVHVIPVSDPNASTMSQRVVQYQAAMQASQLAPEVYDKAELHRQMLEVLGIKNAAKIVPKEDELLPKDPISENVDAINAKPLKAFLHQDHRAHLATHMSVLQDPMMMQVIGQGPNAQRIGGALQAHINEHMAFQYRREIEMKLGVPLPPPDEPLPQDVEVELSRLVAQAAQRLVQQNQAAATQQQAQQQAQDPVMQAQMKELAIKEADVQRKEKKDAADTAIAEEKLKIEAMKALRGGGR